MKKITVVIMLFLATLNARAQKLYKISLDEFKLDIQGINLTVAEIIDARKDKNSIGLIQTGLNNKPVFATFEKPGLKEIESLLENAGLYPQPSGLSLRITALKISENTTLVKETAKAELSIDFFLRYENLYYHITSIFTSAEPKGLDVTSKQAANIVTILEKALTTFSQKKNDVKTDRSYTLEELLDPMVTLRNPLSMPILNDTEYKDGYYTSFDEFVNNQPSIPYGCKVKLSSPIKVLCGEEETEVPALYAFASNNKLYILYHHHFFELNRRNGTFYFNGPSKMSKTGANDVTQMYFGASSIATSYVLPGGRYSATYVLDMETGAIRNITGF
ncbi:hypothetical protein [Chryseolinea sp. H1M3-3]|uniref:hypothetical protein n=1 Tax=Chryseolinea sp. H1M3-3 TaxID=3034144 RepID=UPI0023EC5601|nr:hypothetical protein [Chryseolinea sp. H1M3-3]